MSEEIYQRWVPVATVLVLWLGHYLWIRWHRTPVERRKEMPLVLESLRELKQGQAGLQTQVDQIFDEQERQMSVVTDFETRYNQHLVIEEGHRARMEQSLTSIRDTSLHMLNRLPPEGFFQSAVETIEKLDMDSIAHRVIVTLRADIRAYVDEKLKESK